MIAGKMFYVFIHDIVKKKNFPVFFHNLHIFLINQCQGEKQFIVYAVMLIR